MMKRFTFLLAIAALGTIAAQATVFEANGIYYAITGENTVKVDRVPAEKAATNPYKGVYIIPEQVYYDGANYTITSIGDSAFFQSKATEVQIPNTVTTIGECAFAYASDLTSITLPLHLSSVSKMMLAGTNVVSVAVPEGVKNIGWGAFQSCASLQTMLLPSTTETIEAYGYNNCQSLFEIYCAASKAPNASGWAIFIGLSDIDVIVPDEEALANYQANSVWGDESTFTLYTSEAFSLSMEETAEAYNEQYVRLPLGNNFAYKIYKGDQLLALTAADYYYVPKAAEATTYTIVPTDMMNDSEATQIVVQPTGIRTVQEDANAPIVYGKEGAIHIHGNVGGQMVSVFDTCGRLCFRRHANGDELISLNSGIYIVVVGDKATKVRL